MKTYIITEEQRTEILDLINNRSLLAAKNYLNQLPELKSQDSIKKQKICKLIKEDIELQKKGLKDDKKYFEHNKPFMWRIHGLQSLLSKITGEQFEFYTNSGEKEQ